MNRKAVTLLAGTALLGCELAHAVETLEKRPGFVFYVSDRFAFDDRFAGMDSPHSHVEVREMTITVHSPLAASGQQEHESLDVLRVDRADRAGPPKFEAIFVRGDDARLYREFSTADDLQSFLVDDVGLSAEDAKNWITRAHDEFISIPDVKIPAQFLADCEQ
jgi:hypothetical protein